MLDEDKDVATERVSAIAQGSRDDADMQINIDKTEIMHVKEQGRVSKTTQEEAKAVCKFVCPHIGCNRAFLNVHGCKCHAGRCDKRDIYEVERILAVKGETGSPKRRFLIRWKGYGQDDDTWEPRKNLTRDLVNDFLLANGLYDHNWRGVRCPGCDQPCKSAFGLRIHRKHCIAKPESQQQFQGTCADRKVKHNKLEKACPPQAKKNKLTQIIYFFRHL